MKGSCGVKPVTLNYGCTMQSPGDDFFNANAQATNYIRITGGRTQASIICKVPKWFQCAVKVAKHWIKRMWNFFQNPRNYHYFPMLWINSNFPKMWPIELHIPRTVKNSMNASSYRPASSQSCASTIPYRLGFMSSWGWGWGFHHLPLPNLSFSWILPGSLDSFPLALAHASQSLCTYTTDPAQHHMPESTENILKLVRFPIFHRHFLDCLLLTSPQSYWAHDQGTQHVVGVPTTEPTLLRGYPQAVLLGEVSSLPGD